MQMKVAFHSSINEHTHIMGIFNALCSKYDVYLYDDINQLLPQIPYLYAIVVSDYGSMLDYLPYIQHHKVVVLQGQTVPIKHEQFTIVNLSTLDPMVDSKLFGNGEPKDYLKYRAVVHSDDLPAAKCVEFCEKMGPGTVIIGSNMVKSKYYIGAIPLEDYKHLAKSTETIVTGNKLHVPSWMYAGVKNVICHGAKIRETYTTYEEYIETCLDL